MITLIVLSYNRKKYLIRSAKFWTQYDFKVLYLDGSTHPIENNIIDSLDSNITYIHMPVSLADRMKYGVNSVTTPYIALMCDDEFMLPTGYNQCIEYLEEMPSYSSAIGRAMHFDIQNSNEIRLYDAFPTFRSKDFYFESGVKRAIKHFENYELTHFYSVHRTSAFQTAVNLATMESTNKLGLTEFTLELSMSLIGKSRVMPILHWMRSKEVPPVPHHDKATQNKLPNLIINPGNQSDLLHTYIVTVVQTLSNYERNFCAADLFDIAAAYRVFIYPEQPKVSIAAIARGPELLPSNHTIFRLKSSIRSLIRKLSQPNANKRITQESISELVAQGVSIPYEELGYACQLVVDG